MIINANALHVPLADESVHCVVTSPPYYNAREEYSSWNTYKEYLLDMRNWCKELMRVLCNGGRLAMNVPDGYGRSKNTPYIPLGAHVTAIVQETGFTLRGNIIWNKPIRPNSTAWGSWKSASNPALRDKHEIIIVAHKGSAGREPGESTIDSRTFLMSTESVWNILPASPTWHPAPFPEEIPRRLIELYSYKGDIVLDPFSGSGTTVNVANLLGRRGIGFDLNMGYLRKSLAKSAAFAGDWDVVGRCCVDASAQNFDGLPMFTEQTP